MSEIVADFKLAKTQTSAAYPRLRGAGLALALLAPSLFFLMLFTYFPVLQALLQSMTLEAFGGRITGYGFGNYVALFSDRAFQMSVTNNLVYALGTILPSILIALFLAVALQSSSRFNSALRTIFFFPTLLPLVAAAALFMFVFMPGQGLLDFYLAKIGIRQTNWLGNPDIALYSLIALTVWKNAGYYMLFFLAGLTAIPQDVYDAAKVDGARAFARFWHITVPLLRPTFAFVAVISLANTLTQIDHIVVLTKGGPSDSTNVVLHYIFQQAHEHRDLGRASAATVLSVAALLGLSFVSLKTLERGIHYEGA